VAENKKDSTDIAATRDEIVLAIEALTTSQQRRLEKFSKYKILGLGRKGRAHDYKELQQEAFTSTLLGIESEKDGRRWYKKRVDFVGHLLGAMRSIASHWAEAFDEDEPLLDSEMTIENEDGEISSPMARAQSTAPDQERTFLAKEKLAEILHLFQDDDEAVLVLEGIREGWTGPEIMGGLGLSKDKFEAAMKRIRYRIK
jgi:hypothetical protein